MATNAKIKEDLQDTNIGSAEVELYTIDLSPLGEAITYNFTPAVENDGDAIIFNSVTYYPLNVESDGWEYSSEGKLPRPLITVSNATLTLIAAIYRYNNFINAKLTRRKTYAKYLDGAAEADPDAVLAIDVFYINRKTKQNKYLVEWELKARIDSENVFVPKQQVISYCNHRYRKMDGAGTVLNPDLVTCPYTDSNYFTLDDEDTVNPGLDRCSKKLRGCKLRFPQEGPVETRPTLPFLGFPNIGSFSIRDRR